MPDSFYSSSHDSENLDLGKIFRFILMQSKFIILVAVLGFVVSYINYSTSIKQYKITSLLQFESFNQNVFDPSNSLQMASGNPSSDLSNLASLYESRTNMLQVIRDLKLNIDIQGLSDDENIDIKISTDKNDLFERYKLKVSFTDNNYDLLDENNVVLQTTKLGDEAYFNGLKIIITSSNLKSNRPIKINYRHPESMYNSLKSKILIDTNLARNSFFSNEGLITVSYISDDIDLGKNIINYANKIFLYQRIYDETEKSRKAINFIDKNLKSIQEVVDGNKTKLKEFREKNKSINVNLEIQAIIDKIKYFDESLSLIDIQISNAKETYTSNNPLFLNLLNQKKLLVKQKDEVLSEIQMMPKEQQQYIDLYNNLEISQSLFEELESRRLGFSILEASTIGDVRVVDDAYVVSLVSPRLSYVLFMTIIAFISACFVAIIRGFYFLPISNPAEIFDNNIHIPIIGVIPKVDNIEAANEDIGFKTAIETLIVNINSIQNAQLEKNIITITSASPFNGKSTISRKLAESLSKLGKKVLLIDNDLKRGKLAKIYNLKGISEATFNAIDESTINNYLIQGSLYFIPRVKGLSNSFEFLYNYQYKNKIKFFKDYFDYIIFDTGPVLSVADSSILIEQSDINILVARHAVNKINEIKQSVDNFKQINKNIDGIVYNAYERPKSYYGYYGIYGNYSYKYYSDKYLDKAYEYEK